MIGWTGTNLDWNSLIYVMWCNDCGNWWAETECTSCTCGFFQEPYMGALHPEWVVGYVTFRAYAEQVLPKWVLLMP